MCFSLTEERAEQLQLPPMVPRNEDHLGTAFTVSIDATPAHGVTTGISAADRATTITVAMSGESGDLQRPGHIFPSSRGRAEFSLVPVTPRRRSTSPVPPAAAQQE